jgi:hypothetical protein
MTGRWVAAFLLAAAVTVGGLPAGEPERAPAPAKEPAPKKRQRVVTDLSGFELLDAAKLKDKPVVAGATRALASEKPPAILAPHLAKLHGHSAVFAWRHEAERFAFVLSDEAGQDVHVAEVAGHSYRWPADAPRLRDGATYFWSVRPAPGSETASTSMAAVAIVTSAEREEIDRALTAATPGDPYREGLAHAQVFVDKRVWYDALGAYGALIARFPDRPEAYERRAELFAQLPATQELAEEEFARAEALAREPEATSSPR